MDNILRVLMNADLDEAVAFLAPSQKETERVQTGFAAGGRAGEEHWRWRYRMAQRIAEQLDPHKFGVQAFYLIGSTKNATAGPRSDIDLLLHFAGTEEQRKDLSLWLEGWSRCLAEINFIRTGYRCDAFSTFTLLPTSTSPSVLLTPSRSGPSPIPPASSQWAVRCTKPGRAVFGKTGRAGLEATSVRARFW